MNSGAKNTFPAEKIFSLTKDGFAAIALEVFRFQHAHNTIYHQYCALLGIKPEQVTTLEKIPFLPIRFFKTHTVVTTSFTPEAVFESSGTTQTVNSRHWVKEMEWYKKSFLDGFRLFYGAPEDWCILALLPSYLERRNSSLVVMADELIRQSGHPSSGFYLNEYRALFDTLQQLERQGQRTLLLGVTFALLDFAAQYALPLHHTTLMETGGMKGKRKELTRQEVHAILTNRFQVSAIHSEYGMTELLSQGYSKGNGRFSCPPWMRVLVREEDDPLAVAIAPACQPVTGAANIIDLANIHSCSFIATDDAVRLYPEDQRFEILGRLDHSDVRGCSLLSL